MTASQLLARIRRDGGRVWLDRHGTGECPRYVAVVRSLDELPGLLGIGARVDLGGAAADR